MNDKEIKKLLNKEGKVMFSSSFDAVKNKLENSPKYINQKASTPDVVLEKKPNKKITLATKLTLGLSSIAIAGIVCAVVIPVSMNNSKIAPSAEALCDVDVSCPATNESAKFAFDVNEKGKVNLNSIYPKNELGKKVVSGLKNHYTGTLPTAVDEFTITVVKYVYTEVDVKGQNLISQTENGFCIIHTKGPGAADSDFNTKYQQKIVDGLNQELPNQKLTVNVLADTQTYGTLINDMLLARKSELGDFVNTLFVQDENIIEGFEPNEQFLKDASIDEINDCLNKLQDIYNHIPFDKNLASFKKDLENFEYVFENRRLELFEGRATLETAAKKLWGNKPFDEFNKLKTPFDDNKIPSPFWWKNDFNKEGDLSSIAQYNFPYEQLKYAEYVLNSKEDGGIQEKDPWMEQIDNPVIYLMNAYNKCNELITRNQNFFARVFDYMPHRKNILKNIGDKYPSCLENGKFWSDEDYWTDNINYWNDYWK